MKTKKLQFKIHYNVMRHQSDTSFKNEIGTKKIVVNGNQSLPEAKIEAIEKLEHSFYSNDRILETSFKSIKWGEHFLHDDTVTWEI